VNLDNNSLSLVFTILYVKTEFMKAELFDLMKRTGNEGEYRMAYAIKQTYHIETSLPYRTIPRNLDVNYRNVYNWIKEYGLNRGRRSTKSERNNAGRIPMISSDNNKEMIKQILSSCSKIILTSSVRLFDVKIRDAQLDRGNLRPNNRT